MNRNIVFIVGCLLMYNLAFAQPSIYPNDPHWRLKWEDGFNSFGNTKWLIYEALIPQ